MAWLRLPRFRRAVNVFNPKLFENLSLAAFLAWVGLGSDALSSSAYGPPEIYYALKGHEYLAVFLAIGIPISVFVISAGYRQVIALFPDGGGGYHTASTLLGPKAGLVSGAALIVDYVLTAAISVASGTEALLSTMPASWYSERILLDVAILLFLIFINLRGMKESIKILLPIFMAFILTHTILLGWGLLSHIGAVPDIAYNTVASVRQDGTQYGWIFIVALILRAFSLGGGTYTGLEAVANGVHIMREPRVQTGQRTMTLLATSLSLVAGSLIFLYLMYQVHGQAGQTLNAVLYGAITQGWTVGGVPFGPTATLLTLLTEGLLLFIAANTGIITAPIVMANMAVDRWLPERFSYLSDRFVSRNGVLLIGFAAVVILLMTGGHVSILVVLYSINVFITFTLTMAGLSRHWFAQRDKEPLWRGRLAVSVLGFVVTASILAITIFEKFDAGGWFTLLVTAIVVGLGYLIYRHYKSISKITAELDETMLDVVPEHLESGPNLPLDPRGATAVFFVSRFDGLGLHTLLTAHRMVGGFVKNYVFLLAGIVGQGEFKGIKALEDLKVYVETEANQYMAFCRNEGMAATWFATYSTDRILAMEELANVAIRYFPQSIFFAGRVIDTSAQGPFHGLLHDEVSFIIQDRLQHDGFSMMIVPVHVRGIPSQPPNIVLPISMSPDLELVQNEEVKKEEARVRAAAKAQAAIQTNIQESVPHAGSE
ncbi:MULTISPECIES: APC family permease [Acidithiobacillus]|uniref:APC family permease n=1 Tax=Acidithiobacillus ferruginosus TaxID=3063951 RepID=A0ACD5IFR2_9PROT|nr:APC family permease [Acidithiobacillus ferruginosus]MBU2814553.1 APC family permease [Acidithiobacillus ferruginosus]